MQSLLNPEIIKAAATSPLGVISLMCLIMGVLALGLFRNSPVWAKLLVFSFSLLGLAGFASAVLRQQAPPPAPSVEASREFVIGRWQVEQTLGEMEGGTYVDYESDGRFSGKQQAFINGEGRRESVSGTWNFTKLAKDQFRLNLQFDNGNTWTGPFRIVDHDRIHNIEQNYDAVRVAR